MLQIPNIYNYVQKNKQKSKQKSRGGGNRKIINYINSNNN